jgi:uncharacterized sulfatase
MGAVANKVPNIVFIMMDDMGYGDMGCYGSGLIETPAMDAIVARGIRCTRMYSAPTCSPARAQVLTGKYAQRVGVPRVVFADDAWGLEPSHRTMADYLRERGYATGAFGKWHLGVHPQHLPTRHGFDTYYGPFAEASVSQVEMWRDEQVVERDVPCGATTRRFFEEAEGFLDAHRDQPCLVYVTPTMPHVPIGAEPPFLGRSRAGLYGDAIETIDHYVGRLMEHLRADGRLENTVVMVTSDNGPWYQGRTAGHRGRKFETYEGGVRVPFVAGGPGICPGSVSDEPLHLMDMLPTCLGWAGAPTPDGLDGVDISSVFAAGAPSPHTYLHLAHVYSYNAVIKGDWKLNMKQQRGEYPREGEFPHLINLKLDPSEAYSLTERHPQLVEELETEAESFRRLMAPCYDIVREKRAFELRKG